uniref:ATP synthase subunit C lysine N-methyltransferase n=1 Tax=Equus caballus TaxID=9796 RepID=A0A3Q2HJU6_HORSE
MERGGGEAGCVRRALRPWARRGARALPASCRPARLYRGRAGVGGAGRCPGSETVVRGSGRRALRPAGLPGAQSAGGGAVRSLGLRGLGPGSCSEGLGVNDSVLGTILRGAPPETLREEGQLGCVPPPGLEASCVKKSSWGFLFTGIVGGTLVAVYAVATPFITPALRRICLPFVPATTKQIENVVKMLRGRRGSVVDVGSGDGRIVIAAAKEGFAAAGYELNPWLVWYSRYRAWREGVQGSAKFYISDLWKVSFSQYSNVVIFGVPQMMPQLEKKLELELEDNARVIACRFPFPHWTPDQLPSPFTEGCATILMTLYH